MIGTLRQYEQQAMRDACADSGITQRHYLDCYPPGCRWQEWERTIQDAARAGETIPATVLDDLWTRNQLAARGLLHDCPRAFPPGYLFPGVRAYNRQAEAEFRAARQRGRATSKLGGLG